MPDNNLPIQEEAQRQEESATRARELTRLMEESISRLRDSERVETTSSVQETRRTPERGTTEWWNNPNGSVSLTRPFDGDMDRIFNTNEEEVRAVNAIPKEVKEKFWTIDMPKPDGTQQLRYRGENQEVVVKVKHLFTNKGVTFISRIVDGRVMYELYNGIPNNGRLIASLCEANGALVVGHEYESLEAENGRPIPITREAVTLLREVKGYVESSPELAKKSRYCDLLKPRVDSLLAMIK